jgi:GNAT superfamily N-acetyltransferase
MNNIEFNRIEVSILKDENLESCDFKDSDGSDPLYVNHFIHHRASAYMHYNLSVIYLVKYEGQITGFFSLSMGALEVKRMKKTDKLQEEASQLISYPALLLGNMGVDRKFQRQGIGKWICKYCIGFAIEFSKKIACGYVYLQSNNEKKEFYKKLDFVTSGKEGKNGKIWMYRRIFEKTFKRSVVDNVHISNSISVKKIPYTVI